MTKVIKEFSQQQVGGLVTVLYAVTDARAISIKLLKLVKLYTIVSIVQTMSVVGVVKGLLVHDSGVNNTVINPVLPASALYPPVVKATGPQDQLLFSKIKVGSN